MLKELKERICKNKKCAGRFTPQRPLQGVCSPKCAYEYQKLVKANKEAKEWRDKKRVMEENVKTLSEYETEAKTAFQKWVRIRDKDLPCISCEKTADRYDGGHYFDAGMYSGLIFHPWNCNKQCSMYCNKSNHGNKVNYRIGLVKKIGEENVRWLEENKDKLRNYKFTKPELIAKKLQYQILIKELEKNI